MKKLFGTLFLSLMLVTSVIADAIWIDVRTDQEHAETYIEGDLHIPHDQIATKISTLVPDKNAEIKLYCRSGKRAGLAKQTLEQAGYSNVSNAGGIEDARAERKLK